MLNIEVFRTPSKDGATLGKMYLNGIDTCYTLEDVVRPDGVKVYGETAIPAGRYRVDITCSNRFQCDMPLVCDVPNFEGVRIHPGNTSADTHGCILVGMSQGGASIGASRMAYNIVFPQIRDAIANGEEVWLTINDSREQ